MPAIRKSAALLESSGAFDRNKDRRRTEPDSGVMSTDPPSYFTDQLSQLWVEIIASVPEGVLKTGDRLICEIATRLMFSFRTGSLKAAELSQLMSCLARLGLSPYDRSKIAMTANPNTEDNPFNEFT